MRLVWDRRLACLLDAFPQQDPATLAFLPEGFEAEPEKAQGFFKFWARATVLADGLQEGTASLETQGRSPPGASNPSFHELAGNWSYGFCRDVAQAVAAGAPMNEETVRRASAKYRPFG